ncbi:MAG: amino acid adenylation domain-containing protein [Cyanobacteria bacterium J06598_3]
MIYLLSQILDRSAERFPDRAAFRCEGESITYGELLGRANGLAHWLVANGVERGDRVGIYLSKSLESAIAMYGIWKAGAAYVPLDPSAPRARLSFVIDHCGISHLVTQKSKRRKLPELLKASPTVRAVVGVPDDFELESLASGGELVRCDWSALPVREVAPAVRLVAQDLAYIMYTSGSTGTPKGIMHTHYSGLSYAQLVADTYGLTGGDRIGNHSPLHFDISTLGFFAGPLVGATTVIIPEAYTKVPASLSQLIQDEALTVWYSVPFALSQLWLRGVLDERDFSALRWVLFAGEPFPAKYLTALMAQLPQARFSNIYGPAEVNQCTYYHVPPLVSGKVVGGKVVEKGVAVGKDVLEASVPIGQVWNNSEALVVDERDQPVATGEVGELLVRTATMMSGYWRAPELTAKAFYHTQVANQPAVFYRTGDLVQQCEGEYLFLGRKDRQIKTRGYRVELDAVEAALVAHPQVEEAATYAVPYAEGSFQIGASVILTAGAAVSEAEIKRFAAERLPSYAVPQDVVVRKNFPRTGTGKIDRRALQKMAIDSG